MNALLFRLKLHQHLREGKKTRLLTLCNLWKRQITRNIQVKAEPIKL